MLKQTKGFITGFIVCALFSVLIMNVFAAPIEKVITATYNNIKIYVDGNKIDPKDANGNAVEPFIYNGTTYLPVRAIGTAFGKSVEWDGANQSVYIGKNPNSDTPSLWLDDMDYFNFQVSSTVAGYKWRVWNSANDKDSTGNTHEHGIYYTIPSHSYNGWQYTEYLLNAKYTKFKGEFSLTYVSRSCATTTKLEIYGDGKLLYEAITIGGILPQKFDIDVTGVIKLRIHLGRTYSDAYYVGITDAGFYE